MKRTFQKISKQILEKKALRQTFEPTLYQTFGQTFKAKILWVNFEINFWASCKFIKNCGIYIVGPTPLLIHMPQQVVNARGERTSGSNISSWNTWVVHYVTSKQRSRDTVKCGLLVWPIIDELLRHAHHNWVEFRSSICHEGIYFLLLTYFFCYKNYQ